MADYLIQDTTMQGIADAVRNMRHEKGEMTPAQIEAKIKESVMGIPVTISNHINPKTGKWERPADWPDIDALADQIVGDQDCVYLTYDLRKTPGYGWVGIWAKTENSSAWTIERGHIFEGLFVADYTVSIAHNGYFREALDDTYGDVQIWRVTATGHITNFAFASDTNGSTSFRCDCQPCVQRAGTLPWLQRVETNRGQGGTSLSNIWIERDALTFGKNAVITTLANCWGYSYSLQSLDLSKFNTSNWQITSLNGTWGVCISLHEIDTSSWDTSNWTVTSLQTCFSQCYSLRSLDLSGWDTSNWAVTSLQRCWFQCFALQSIDMTGWDTTNWAVTTLEQTFNLCMSLQDLDLSSWNTENWNITTLTNCFAQCYSLTALDLHYLDTSNWHVSFLNNCFYDCCSLRSINIAGWDTSDWNVTNMANIFFNCRSIELIDLSGWDVSNWNISGMNNFFPGCFSLREIKGMSSWGFVKNLSVANVIPTDSLLFQTFDGIQIGVNHSYNNCFMLTPQSLINILTALPTVSSTQTITLGTHNKLKLTPEQIAIATNKGWTVA